MTITYENTAEDAVAWMLHRDYGSPRARAAWHYSMTVSGSVAAFLAGVSSAVFYPAFQHTRTHQKAAGILIAVLVSVLAYAVVFLFRYLNDRRISVARFRRLLRQGDFARYFSPRTVTASSEGLCCAWDGCEARLGWHTVGPVETTDTHLFIDTLDVGPLVLPRRAFTAEMSAETFTEGIEQFRRGDGSAATASSTRWYHSRASVESEPAPVRSIRNG